MMTTEERLGVLEQIEAIKSLKHRYFRACDAKEPDTVRSCFIADADIDYDVLGRFEGVDQLVAVYRRVALHQVDGKHVIFDMHHGMHPEITLTGPGAATGRWTLKFRQVNLIDRTERLLTGEYDDSYVIEDGQWKIARCHFRQLWSITRLLGPDVTVQA